MSAYPKNAKLQAGFKAIAGLTLSLMAASAFGQAEITVGNGSSQAGGTASTSIDWVEGNDVAELQIEILYDDTVLTPQNNGDTPPVVDGCLDGLGGSHAASPFTDCVIASPGRVVLTVHSNFTFDLLPTTNIGSISWDVDAGATVPSTEALEANELDVTLIDESNPDPATTFTAIDGSVDVVDTPPEEISELAVTPAALGFGTVDLGNMPVTDTITAENVGGSASSLTINTADYTGDAEFSVITDGCTGTTLAQNETCDVVVEFDAGANGSYSGAVAFDSDADTNPTANVEVSGSADSVADLSVNPAFGPVDLGTVVVGSGTTAGGSVSNNGSADGDFSCTLSGDPEISTNPDLAGPITVAAGESVDFSLACDVPDTAAEGDTFNATLECSGDNGFGGTHEISCGATEFVQYPVPTMSKVGMGILALLMVMIGGLTVRFFRT